MLETISRYYAERLDRFGATPAGVDWNSAASQALRFAQLLRTVDDRPDASINDFGCGYGALADYLRAAGRLSSYCGIDLVESMVQAARQRHADTPGCTFTSQADTVRPADYTLASGVFNVKLDCAVDAWLNYVLDTLGTFDRLSLRGFAFNLLSTYSDVDKRRDDLFYGDPLFFFDYCKRQFSPRVALLHDYPLYEFTVIVRK